MPGYRQADRDEGRQVDGLTSRKRVKLQRLRKENKRLRQEREIFAKAAAWFAAETDAIPPKSSEAVLKLIPDVTDVRRFVMLSVAEASFPPILVVDSSTPLCSAQNDRAIAHRREGAK